MEENFRLDKKTTKARIKENSSIEVKVSFSMKKLYNTECTKPNKITNMYLKKLLKLSLDITNLIAIKTRKYTKEWLPIIELERKSANIPTINIRSIISFSETIYIVYKNNAKKSTLKAVLKEEKESKKDI